MQAQNITPKIDAISNFSTFYPCLFFIASLLLLSYNSRLNISFLYNITRFLTSCLLSFTITLFPDVKVITVSGDSSTFSIKSALMISFVSFNLVTSIIFDPLYYTNLYQQNPTQVLIQYFPTSLYADIIKFYSIGFYKIASILWSFILLSRQAFFFYKIGGSLNCHLSILTYGKPYSYISPVLSL